METRWRDYWCRTCAKCLGNTGKEALLGRWRTQPLLALEQGGGSGPGVKFVRRESEFFVSCVAKGGWLPLFKHRTAHPVRHHDATQFSEHHFKSTLAPQSITSPRSRFGGKQLCDDGSEVATSTAKLFASAVSDSETRVLLRATESRQCSRPAHPVEDASTSDERTAARRFLGWTTGRHWLLS